MMRGRFISDTDLLTRLQDDDEQALLALMQRYDKALFRYILSKTNSLEASEEAVQDIFISLWHNRYAVAIDDTLSPYLFKAAKNKTIDFYLAGNKKLAHFETLLPDYEHMVSPSPENEVIEAELEDWLSSEVDKMPDNVRNVFKLSRVEQLPVKEIAGRLALSEQTVKNNLTIALKRLQLRLKRMESFPVFLIVVKILLHQS
ncbi:RNA polymerase sigma-70 factor (ECF subfamily) [Mucilaginibacter lappiensis]|uniref:RNA polymerase sigma-70 factor (ECF subfamily) n=1 Tax=Mucilaginibacter lappiensis TaxID=354630 RepID=A0ABR6PS72_9SPHI|nr:sigma-70 family RNA polymerase sigma factor [Mucilaginibacter lappiensis]MBB6112423.1 RNA polymerase sigma-70 factor (ECF subfamily) [Mucilaginibacter lappiensis]